MRNLLLWGFAIISFLGFMDAVYLTVTHYTGTELNCGPGGGCNVVTRSEYSTILGVPVALFGALYYLSIFFLTLLYVDTKNAILLRVLPILTLIGLLASGWFVFVQLVLLNTICRYCMVSATTSTLLFILGILLFIHNKKNL